MEANGIPKYVDLNVGGTHYTTSLSTLTSYPDSLLYKIFSKSTIPLDKDRKGRYVIDRDGKVFRYILNFLRGGHLNLHGNFKEYDQLREEVTYYKLKAMKSLLNDWQTGKNKRINPEQQIDENGTEGRRKDITPEMLDLDPDTVDNDYQSDMELPDECDTPLWFMDTNFRKSPYVPQMGDEVMYFWQGHKCYVEAVKKQCVYDIDGTKFPWDRGDLKTEEPMRVVGLEYHSGPPITCEIKVVSINPVTKKIAGKNFQFRYHVMPEIKDFMILTQHYEISMKRKWKVGDQFRAAIDNKWCLGVIKDKKPTDTEYPESFFQGFVIRWKNGKSDVLSLWDLEPIESKDSFIKVGEGTQITNTEMQQLRYNPTTGDWSGSDQNTECDRIRACLDQITSLEVAKILTAPIDHSDDLDDSSVVPYPIKLETIRERLKKRFYRRRLALQWEVRQIETNANLFNEPDSEVVKSAELVTNILLEVVRNVKVDNAVDLYNRMAGIIDTEQETEKKGKERSNGVKKVFSSDEESVGKQETERKGKKRSRTVKVSSSDEESESKQKTERKAKNRSRRAKKVSSSDEESDDETKTPPKKRRSTRMHDEKRWVTECENLLVDILFPLEDSKYFRTPNSKSSVFKDYADVIEEPMDLTTVKERMSRGDYENPHEFAKDIRLIVSNSKAYFTDKKSKIYSMTREFSKVFEDNIRDILMNYKNAAAYKKLPRGNGTPSSIKKGKDRKQDSWEKLTPPDKPGPSGIQKKPKTLQACSYTSTLKAKEDEDDSDRETVCSAPALSDDEWQQSAFDNLSGTDEDDITAKTRDRTPTTKSPKIKLRPLKVKGRGKSEEMPKQTKHRKSSSSSDDSIFEVDLLHDSS